MLGGEAVDRHADLDPRVQRERALAAGRVAVLVREHGFVEAAEHTPLAVRTFHDLGHVVHADDHVLRRRRDRTTRRGRQDVVGRQHE